MSVLITGSVALDSVKTQTEEHHQLLGGSASYAAVAASFFSPVRMVGIVGDDFPQEYLDLFASRSIDLGGLQRAKGKTFAWSGEYEVDMNRRRTLSVELNVFEHFRPDLPDAWKKSPFVLLANIAPQLQLHVLDQLAGGSFVIADTMDLWINIAKNDLLALLKRVDMLILNDSEAKELVGTDNLVCAGRSLLALGPRYVAIKKGEHGCMLFGDKLIFSVPAYPLDHVADPTGAGDCFAGGLIGSLAAQGASTFDALKKAVVHGTAVAAYNVEDFSLRRLRALARTDIDARAKAMVDLTRFDI